MGLQRQVTGKGRKTLENTENNWWAGEKRKKQNKKNRELKSKLVASSQTVISVVFN